MQDRSEILKELEPISPLVSTIGAENLYLVPQGYFEQLATGVLANIRAAEASTATGEVEALSPVIGRLGKRPTFNVPDGYFELFASRLLARIQAGAPDSAEKELEQLSPFLSKLPRKGPFVLPENYFEELTANAVAGAQAVEFVNEELENLSPVLEELRSRNVYVAPTGYFDRFAGVVLSKIGKQQSARVLTMGKKTAWLRYAAAAVVIGFIVMTSVLVLNNRKAVPLVASVAKIDDRQLVDSLHIAKDEDILDYMQSHNISVTDATSSYIASLDLSDGDVNDMLADVPDSELQQYMKEYSGAKEITTN